MERGEPSGSLGGILDRLQQARARIRLMLLADAATIAAGIGLALFVVLELLRRLSPETLVGLPGGDFGPIGLSLAVALFAFAIGAVIAAGWTPSVAQLAQRSDHLFGLGERVSTALEIEDGDKSVLTKALLRDVGQRTATVEPARLGRLRFPRAFVGATAGLIAAIAVVAAVPARALPQPDANVVVQPTGALSEGERAAVAADIERVADLVEDQAEAQKDPLMQAVANTLRALGEEVANSPETTREDILDELGSLRQYAAEAASQYRGEEASQRVPSLLDALTRAVATPRPDGASPRAPLPGQADTAAQSGQAGDNTSAGEGSEAMPSDELNAMLDNLQQPAAPVPEGAANVRVNVDYFSQKPKPNSITPGAPNSSTDGAELIGAATESTAGDSQLAGAGTDDLNGEAQPLPKQVDILTAVEMVLRADDQAEGRRIKFEATPEANLTPITEQSLGDNRGIWAKTPEGEVARAEIGVQYREPVSKYLRALLGQVDPE